MPYNRMARFARFRVTGLVFPYLPLDMGAIEIKGIIILSLRLPICSASSRLIIGGKTFLSRLSTSPDIRSERHRESPACLGRHFKIEAFALGNKKTCCNNSRL